MKNLKSFKRSLALGLFLVASLGYSQKKIVESFNVNDNVEVNVNTSFTNVVFETWNKDKVEVEAFIEGENLSEKEKEDLLKNWDLKVTGNSKNVTITSNSANQSFAMAEMPQIDFIGPMMEDMILPMVQNIQVPPLPPDVMEHIGSIQFDYDEFEKDEEGYMKKFEAQMDKKFGKDFEEKMEAWGKKLEESMERNMHDSVRRMNDKRSEAFEKRMEAYGKRMEAWGEAYGKKMEAWAKEIEKNYDDEGGNYSKTVTRSPNGTSIVIQGNKSTSINNSKAKKTIIIRLPKNSKTVINVRHGEIKMADAINVRANLNYTPFTANSIDGGQTLINASYAPVMVNVWRQGALQIKFVDECKIETVQNINLQANSSDVRIGNITNQAFLSGSFGDLKIAKVSDGFETLDIRLENTDAKVKVPTGAFSIYFTGRKSTLKYPKLLQLKESKNADRVVVKGYNLNNSSNKTININSSYSDVILQ